MKGLPAVLIVAILLVRVLAAWNTAHAGQTLTSRIPRAHCRKCRFLLVWLLAFPACGAFIIARPYAITTYLPGMIFLTTVMLWPIARYLLAPLGLVRAAYFFGLGGWSTVEDRGGSGLLAASIALHRKRDLDPEAAAWIDDKIQKHTLLRAGGIAAAGALAAARGDRDGARVLFDSVRTLDPSAVTRVAKNAAAEWLAADAASRGAWQEVLDLQAGPLGRGGSVWFLANVASRLLGKPGAPGRARLVAAWLLAPRRWHTFPILERALSVPDGAAPLDDDDLDDPVAQAAPAGDPLARALATHVRLLAMKKPAPADVVHAGRAWDAVFDEDALPAEIVDRGAMLGAARPAEALPRLREDVEDSLFQLLKAHRIALDDTIDDLGLGEIAYRAQRRLRDETLAVIEALSDAVRHRVDERRALPIIDEWREWSALRIAYERGVTLGGPELRYLAFTKVHSDVCALAVWLFNERKERGIANAMFRFLLDEATATGDTQGITLQSKNVSCGV